MDSALEMTIRYAVDKVLMKAPSFRLKDVDNQIHTLPMLMGEMGLLLAFSGDIWSMAGIRQAMWLQRYSAQFALFGVRSALIAPNDSDALRSFAMSSPLSIPFKLLADPHQEAYKAYNSAASSVVLVSHQGYIEARWVLGSTGALWVMHEVLRVIQTRL